MNDLICKVLMVLLALASLPVKASETYETNKYMLDMVSAGIASRTSVRVKVFPHEHDYKPQGLDLVRDQIKIESEGSCQTISASQDKAVATGTVLQTFKSIDINAS